MDWNQRLREAEEDDHFDLFGNFESDETFKNDYNETYDQWADRIAAEFTKRYKSPKESYVQPPPPEKSSMATPKLKLKSEKKPSKLLKAEDLFDKDSKKTIKAKDLPFDETTPSESIVHLLLGQNHDKKSVKEILRKWHPDKFAQQLQHRIHPGHKDKIFRIVTHVSQALLNFGR